MATVSVVRGHGSSHHQVRELSADRISNLPSMITERILECLPLREAVRMSILSRYWRYQWCLIPHLILDYDFFLGLQMVDRNNVATDHDLLAYSDIVNKLLLLHAGPIRKFSLYIPGWVPVSAAISHWIHSVSAKGRVEEFIMKCDSSDKMKLPSTLFSCLGLTYLKLSNCYICSLPPTFSGFPCLTRLRLDTCDNETYLIGLNLISRCPQLESLSLHLDDVDVITSNIHAPKLQDLVLHGAISLNINFKRITKLRTLSLKAFWRSRTELEKCLCCLPNSIETLLLGNFFWMVNHPEDVPKIHIHGLLRLKTLKIAKLPVHCSWAISRTLSLFGSCQNLQELKITVVASTLWHRCQCRGDMLLKIKEDCSLKHLKNVALECLSSSNNDLQLVKLLLACSPVLEVMTIELTKSMTGAEEKLNVTRQLLQYRRVSKNAEIIFKS